MPANSGGEIVTTEVESPLGTLVAGATDGGICLLEFAGGRRVEEHCAILGARWSAAVVRGDNHHLARLRAELGGYFAGKLTAFTGPLVMCGTPFEERVWTALCGIPYGATASYGELARTIGESVAAARAVGRANGHNRIAIVIPCHRVIGQDRSLVGYGGGLWRKKHLLELEQRQCALFSRALQNQA
jgi:AraC family transcriptional regulator of adaptative response/methylated-DNA-[protein]-cysteine methyltransferase